MDMTGVNPATTYDDVLDSWNYYLAHENKGRGVVLIGHSQGSGLLTQLISKEIDGKPVQAKIVSAILMGTRLPVDKGKDTGLFKSMPLCHSASQTGCVIAYASFRDTIPPPANSLFGKAPTDAQIAACANPANLAPGGKGEFHAYLSNGAQIANSSAFHTKSPLSRSFRDLRVQTLHENLDKTAATLGKYHLGQEFDTTARL